MTSTIDNGTEHEFAQNQDKEDEMCKIEASVVTGFEECARGEAREKFGVNVTASRGKIVFEIPFSRLHEIQTMGSIDNFRVVMLTIPYFNFSDQNDSLAKLQKMIVDVNWESGLKAWKQIFNFPHTVASCPDVIPTPEQLVDVVVMTRLPQAKDKSEKKKKGKGKGKKKNKEKVRSGTDKKIEDSVSVMEDKSKDENLCERNPEVKGEESVVADVDTDVEPPSLGSSDLHAELNNEMKEVKESSECDQRDFASDEVKDNTIKEISNLTLEEHTVSSDGNIDLNKDRGQENEQLSKSQSHPVVAPPKTVIIKKKTSAENEPKVDIRVMEPEPVKSVFPTALSKEEIRHLEPMEIDSPICSSKFRKNLKQSPDTKEEHLDSTPTDKFDGDKINSDKTTEEAETFASSVIRRLCTPPTSPSRPIPTVKLCVTPPPTPILSVDDPYLSIDRRPEEAPCEPVPVVVIAGTRNHQVEECGSSTDPPEYNNISISVSSAQGQNGNLLSEDLRTTKAKGEDILDVKYTLASNDGVVSIETSNALDLEGGQSNNGKDEIITKAANVSSAEDSSSEKLSPVKEAFKDVEVVNVAEKIIDPSKPRFRVTCNRVGEHKFDSASAAASFGSAVITYFGWPVDLKKFDIEVLLNIDNEEVSVGIGLTKASLHNRNLVAFGPTTLRATICFNMLRLCRIRNGDFICDPMCGTSAIPVESSYNWTNCYTFGGDYHEKAIERTVANLAAIQKKAVDVKKSHLKVDAVQWNIEHFPLRDAMVDVFVSDLPFGHRLGSRTVNRTLYPNLLTEMARTARTGARACLLTEDRTSLIKAIQTVNKFWQRRLIQNVNIGGLSGVVFVLIRTASQFMYEEVGLKQQSAGATKRGTDGNNVIVPPSTTETDECQPPVSNFDGAGDANIEKTTLDDHHVTADLTIVNVAQPKSPECEPALVSTNLEGSSSESGSLSPTKITTVVPVATVNQDETDVVTE